MAARVEEITGSTVLRLNEPATVTGSASFTFAQDTYPVPADFAHFQGRTMWDRTQRWQVLGPMSASADQALRSGYTTTGPRRRYRQVGRGLNVLRLYPPPTSTTDPSIISYEYLSRYWATDASGAPIARYTTDTDTAVFPDNIMRLGLKAKFWQSKGFDPSIYVGEYERAVMVAIARDGSAAGVIRMGGNGGDARLISPWDAPDSGYGAGYGSTWDGSTWDSSAWS